MSSVTKPTNFVCGTLAIDLLKFLISYVVSMQIFSFNSTLYILLKLSNRTLTLNHEIISEIVMFEGELVKGKSDY